MLWFGLRARIEKLERDVEYSDKEIRALRSDILHVARRLNALTEYLGLEYKGVTEPKFVTKYGLDTHTTNTDNPKGFHEAVAQHIEAITHLCMNRNIQIDQINLKWIDVSTPIGKEILFTEFETVITDHNR